MRGEGGKAGASATASSTGDDKMREDLGLGELRARSVASSPDKDLARLPPGFFDEVVSLTGDARAENQKET